MTNAASHPFIGVVESPLSGQPQYSEALIQIRGWTLAGAATPASAEPVSVRAAWIDGPPTMLATSIARPDVEDAFPDAPPGAIAGFEGFLDASGRSTGTHEIVIDVLDGNGSRLHGWRRNIGLIHPDEVYERWRSSALAKLPRHPPRTAPGAIEWVVLQFDDADPAGLARTIGSIGTARVFICRPGSDASNAQGWQSLRRSSTHMSVLFAGDTLAAGAADFLDDQIATHPDTDFLYTDHDTAAADGRRTDPVLKPGWSSRLRDHPDMVSRGAIIRRDLLQALPLHGIPESALARCRRVRQICLPLVSLACSVVSVPRSTGDEMQSGRGISVVVLSRCTDLPMLARCLDGVRREGDRDAIEIVVVLNNLQSTTFAEAVDFLAAWDVVVVQDGGAFNWSAMNNRGARVAIAQTLLFLNDDVEPLEPGWIAAMQRGLDDSGVGAVGAILRYPQGRIQHAGVTIHAGEGLDCRHTFRHCTGQERRIARWLSHDRTQVAVTGACLMTRRRDFRRHGGFDEGLAIVFNDIDYCLRLRTAGLTTIVSASARLIHHEGVSRGGLSERRDHQLFSERWAGKLLRIDPCSHPNISRHRDDWMLDPETAANLRARTFDDS